jgi:uncharacterized protein with PQ loop repeat
MKTSQHKPFKSRTFNTVMLFFSMSLLLITGILIEIFEEVELEFPMHFCTAVHVFTGMVFAIVAIRHLISNWRSMKAYIQKGKKTAISKETILALFCMMIIIVLGFFVAYIFF